MAQLFIECIKLLDYLLGEEKAAGTDVFEPSAPPPNFNFRPRKTELSLALDPKEPVEPSSCAKRSEKIALFFVGKATADAASFHALMNICCEEGFNARVYPGYPTILPDAFHQKRLKEYIDGFCLHHHQLNTLLLVGHGTGGLLARSVVEQGLAPGAKKILVTLGTPHQPCWGELPRRDPRYDGVPFLNLQGGYDQTVPHSHGFHPQAIARAFHIDHYGLLTEQGPRDAFREFLKHPRIVAKEEAA